MFQLNETFLEGLGVENMDAAEKKNFLEYVQDQIETRVGERVTAELSAEEEDEFIKLVDGEDEVVGKVMMRYPHYEDEETFAALKQSAGDEKDALVQFAMAKWMEEKGIDYQEMVKHVINEVRREIYENREQILAK